jgi:uncharacterized protein YbaR (Trm112 family)
MNERRDEPATTPATGPVTSPTTSSERTAPRLLELLVCPLTKTSLEYDEKNQELISRSARLAYPIKSGVPYLLPSEARHID